MDWNLKKMWPAVAASLVAFTTVNADYNNNNNTQQNQNQNQNTSQMNQQPMVRNGVGPDMMITPNANISNRLYLKGEALFWWAREGGLEFAISDPCYDEPNSIFHGARFRNPKTKWNTGFRVGLGYVFEHDGWDLAANWTYFQSRYRQACGPSNCPCDCSSVCCGCSLSGCCNNCEPASSSSSSSSECISTCSVISSPSPSPSSCISSSSSGCCYSSSSDCCSSSSSSSGCCSSSSSSSDCCFSSSSSSCCNSCGCSSNSCGCSSSSSSCCSSSSECGISCCSSPWCGTTIPLWSDIPTDGSNLTVGTAGAKWKVRLNVVDLDLGRAFMTSKYLELRPTIGVRGAWTTEKYKIFYGDFNNVQQPAPIDGREVNVNVFAQNIELINRTWGVGPKLGIDSRWTMGWGFSFYGSGAISLLYGNYSMYQRNVASYDIEFDDEASFCNELCGKIGGAYHLGQAVTDLALGLMWEHNFGSDWKLGFNVGWEQHLFFNRNQYWRITRPGGPDGFTNDFSHERGDLSFQGISLGGAIDF